MSTPDSTGPDPRGHQHWLRQAVALACQSVAAGGGPFGAVVVQGGSLIASGQNRVTADHDPTAHAEISAIRAAGRITNNHSLAGAVLYSSCEPCPMCAAAIHWSRLDRVYFAAPRRAAADAGFDDALLDAQLALPAAQRLTACVALELPEQETMGPFVAWADRADRVPY